MIKELHKCLFCDNMTNHDECAVCNPEAYFEVGTDEHWHLNSGIGNLLKYHFGTHEGHYPRSIHMALHLIAGVGNSMKQTDINKIKLFEFLLTIVEEDTSQHQLCARYLAYYRAVQIIHLEDKKYK